MNYNNILFLDIETVSQYETYHHMPADWRDLWEVKAAGLIRNKETETSETVYHRSAIYAEFGKIICISCGCLQGVGDDRKMVIKSFVGDDEKKLLLQFAEMLQKWSKDADKFLCAHNGKEFDFPYICRRMVINCLPLPPMLNIAGKKPWDVPHIDTLEMWKFGDFKSFTSLSLLAGVLGIPTPKDDIDGSMVSDVYWKERNLPRIVHYCQKDVVTVAQVYLRLIGETCIETDNIEIKE